MDDFSVDNRSRAERLQQLVDDASGNTRALATIANSADDKQKSLTQSLNEVLKREGRDNLDDFVTKATETLSEEDAQSIRNFLQALKDSNTQLENVFYGFGYLVTATSSIVTATKALEILKSGALVVASLQTINAFRAASGGADKVATLVKSLKAALNTIDTMTSTFRKTTQVGKVIRFVKTGAKVLTYVGIGIDVVIAIFAAIEGAKQRESLREGIIANFESRIITTFYYDLGLKCTTFVGNIQTLVSLDLFATTPEQRAFYKSFAESEISKTLKNLDDELDKVTFRSAAESWTEKDRDRNSFTTEDPNLEDLLSKLEAEDDSEAVALALTAAQDIPYSFSLGFEMGYHDVTYIEKLCSVPVKIKYDVTAKKSGTQFIGTFTFNRVRDSSSDALTWFLSTYSHNFTFRHNLYARYGNATMHRGGFHLPVGQAVTIECIIRSTEAVYYVNGEKYASVVYSSDEIPQKGYFAFNTYGESEALVEKIVITPVE